MAFVDTSIIMTFNAWGADNKLFLYGRIHLSIIIIFGGVWIVKFHGFIKFRNIQAQIGRIQMRMDNKKNCQFCSLWQRVSSSKIRFIKLAHVTHTWELFEMHKKYSESELTLLNLWPPISTCIVALILNGQCDIWNTINLSDSVDWFGQIIVSQGLTPSTLLQRVS